MIAKVDSKTEPSVQKVNWIRIHPQETWGHMVEYTTIKYCLYGAAAIISIPGLILACISLQYNITQYRNKALSSHVYGIALSMICILSSFINESKLCRRFVKFYEYHTYGLRWDHAWGEDYIDAQLDVAFHTWKFMKKLLIIAQSFDRYVLICKPHLKHILTIPKSLLAICVCLSLGVLNWFLDYRAGKDFLGSAEFKAGFFLYAFGPHGRWCTRGNILNDKEIDKSYESFIPPTYFAYSTYHLFIALVPCVLGIYFNWSITKDLKKACAFVDNARRNIKFSRIMKLSSFFMYMVVFYFLVDLIHQVGLIYKLIVFVISFDDENEYDNLWYRFSYLKHPAYGLMDALNFTLYSFQTIWISTIFVWFIMNNHKEEKGTTGESA